MGTTEQLNNFEVHSNTPSNLCCVSTSAGPQKLVPLDAYGRPDINRWMTTYHGDYNTYHDPRDGITFNWKTEEEQKQEKATCIGCQHSPATLLDIKNFKYYGSTPSASYSLAEKLKEVDLVQTVKLPVAERHWCVKEVCSLTVSDHLSDFSCHCKILFDIGGEECYKYNSLVYWRTVGELPGLSHREVLASSRGVACLQPPGGDRVGAPLECRRRCGATSKLELVLTPPSMVAQQKTICIVFNCRLLQHTWSRGLGLYFFMWDFFTAVIYVL
ncbi:uncharacterized protein LOC134346664 isoform X2 [Mobula hypostoma]